MKIGIDIDVDGVMADFTKAFTSLAVSLGLTDKVTRQAIQPTWHFDTSSSTRGIPCGRSSSDA
jgi:hypothetical protein